MSGGDAPPAEVQKGARGPPNQEEEEGREESVVGEVEEDAEGEEEEEVKVSRAEVEGKGAKGGEGAK